MDWYDLKIDLRFKRTEWVGSDGLPIRAFTFFNPGKEVALVFHPICVKIDLIAPLLNELSRFFSVISWESRGTYAPLGHNIVDPSCLNVKSHLNDMEHILSQFEVNEIDHVVGFCSGAEMAIAAINMSQSLSPRSLSLVAPALRFDEAQKTDYQVTTMPMWEKIISGNDHFRQEIVKFFQERSYSSDSVTGLVHKINSEPFKHEDILLMYSYLQTDLGMFDHRSLLQGVNTEVLALHAEDDTIVHPDVSRIVKTLLPNSQCVIQPRGGHFVFHADFSYIELVLCNMWYNKR